MAEDNLQDEPLRGGSGQHDAVGPVKMPAWRRPADACRVREVLDRMDYTSTGIAALLGVPDLQGKRAGKEAAWMRRTRGGTPLETLVRLFILGAIEKSDRVRRAVEPMRLEEWAEIGLLEFRGESVLSCVHMLPYRDLRLVYDLAGDGSIP